jgi:adenine-specific DNA-methyltransferase
MIELISKVMNKKELGAFYTPHHTANYMVDLFDNFSKESNLLEPSGGDGVFVSAVLNKKRLEESQMTVWDINPNTKEVIESIGINDVFIKDTLLETELSDSLLSNHVTFSHVIGNPPYLNKQSSYIKNNKSKLRQIFGLIGVNDTYAMFIYLCCKLLKKDGQLCLIVSDTFLTLGIHKKLRKFLLEDYTIKEITLCPKDLFKETGATVNTCIIYLKNKKPSSNDCITFNDCRNNIIGDYIGKKYKMFQQEMLTYPDYIFGFNGSIDLLKKIGKFKKIVDILDGGLGMHTTNNTKYLGVIDYNGVRYADGGLPIIPIDLIDGKKWRFYHKKGGNNKYYMPAEHCIRWDKESVSNYKIPKTINLNEDRQGVIVSGISSELSARLAIKGALWESNKAFCFFPKDSKKYPPEFFVGILNSKIYNDITKLFNHTVSLQIRDLNKLPLFDFTNIDVIKIANIVKSVINNKKDNIEYSFSDEQEKINQIINKYI